MTDPITPSEAAAANAIDANLVASQNANNADLAGGATTEPTEQELADRAHALEAQLAVIQARKVAAGQGVPHGHIVPAAQEHKAGDKPVVHTAAKPAVIAAAASPGVVEKAVSYSAKLAEIQASGVVKPKKVYAYKRNRK